MRKERRELFAAQQALLTEGLARNASEARAKAAESQVAWWKNVAQTADKHRMEMMAERDDYNAELDDLHHAAGPDLRVMVREQWGEQCKEHGVKWCGEDACRLAAFDALLSATAAGPTPQEDICQHDLDPDGRLVRGQKIAKLSNVLYELRPPVEMREKVARLIYRAEGDKRDGSRVTDDEADDDWSTLDEGTRELYFRTADAILSLYAEDRRELVEALELALDDWQEGYSYDLCESYSYARALSSVGK